MDGKTYKRFDYYMPTCGGINIMNKLLLNLKFQINTRVNALLIPCIKIKA